MGLTAAQRKNLKKKLAKERKATTHVKQENGVAPTKQQQQQQTETNNTDEPHVDDDGDADVEIEYVAESVPITADDGGEFSTIFNRFAQLGVNADDQNAAQNQTPQTAADGTEVSASATGEKAKPTKKERKAQKLAAVGVLKQIVKKPEIVEVWDATAADPEFLVYLKGYRNSVPVPKHWAQKKRYLQGKRGVDKKPFELPDFIQATGIAKLREAYIEREETKKLKFKGRDKLTPKLGKMDINYQVLHDAFFKHQRKPASLTPFGDLYYEGREFETKLAAQRPGVLSPELRAALGMSERDPPPYLGNMQRVGPPISYPNLRIPGLNAPLPPGATWGFQPGEWGRAPLDQFGRPLYGDVFGTAPVVETVQVDRTRWGEIVADASDVESDDESESESESDDEDDNAAAAAAASAASAAAATANAAADGYQSVPVSASGFSSVQSGGTTPANIALRKQGAETPSDGFTVLKEQKTSVGDELMGVTHTYAIPSNVIGASAASAAAIQQNKNNEPSAEQPEMKLSKRKADSKKEAEKSKRLKF